MKIKLRINPWKIIQEMKLKKWKEKMHTLLKNQNEEINKRYQEQKNNYENIIANLQTKAF